MCSMLPRMALVFAIMHTHTHTHTLSLSVSQTHTNTHMCTHTHIYIYIYIYIYTLTLSHTHSHSPSLSQTHTNTHTHTQRKNSRTRHSTVQKPWLTCLHSRVSDRKSVEQRLHSIGIPSTQFPCETCSWCITSATTHRPLTLTPAWSSACTALESPAHSSFVKRARDASPRQPHTLPSDPHTSMETWGQLWSWDAVWKHAAMRWEIVRALASVMLCGFDV